MEIKNNNQFNILEKTILGWFIENYKNPILTAQIENARLKERRWTKVGFYVDLEVSNDLKSIDWSSFKKEGFPINGPDIESEDIEFGACSLLWGKNGYINCIELAAFGSFFKEHVKNFKLISQRK